ncbi:hypothetical protein O181_089545 [Austropuccinia psidii MF-1]|uniref:Integrase catalytic domain-containing protein n=1 Tax=Austropuccinia psidii MF-1 TaxID=1389203 RepID=A0A9Q3P5Z1_9BASI|nr:hypothetical protein [Austropuccinia psidii MF-1]
MSSKVLTRLQACWAEFHFPTTYRLGRLATLADALSRWDNVYPERGEDFISKNPMNFQQLIKKDEVQPSRYFAVKVESFSNLIDSIQYKLLQDSQYRSILQVLGKGKSIQDYSLDSSSQLLLFKDWVVVQNDPTIHLSILQKCHYSPLAGNPGQEKTLKLVKQDFHWSGMTQFIKDYVSSCQQCSRNKNIHHKKFGLLNPLPVPNGPWIWLSMDFITQLPLSSSFDSILVIVDRFSKMLVFIPTMSSITSLDLAHLFIKNIFSKNGLPSRIVSDRGPLFVSSFWTNLCQQLKISRDLSTAYHPETDVQTERQSLFFTVYGRDPQFDSVHITQDTPAGNLSPKVQSVQKDVKRELEVAINRFKRYADKSRASPPVFNPGDMSFSNHEESHYSCLLPQASISMKINPPSLPYFPSGNSQDINNPKLASESSPPITIEEEEEWEVSQVLDSKLKRRKLWYLVEWKVFSQDPERSTWEPAENVNNGPELVKDCHSLYPDNPRPNSSKA